MTDRIEMDEPSGFYESPEHWVNTKPVTDLAAIRERAAVEPHVDTSGQVARDRRALLAHIDALAAKVKALPPTIRNDIGTDVGDVSRDAVLAILEGKE
jgi:hypothetical protein